MDSWSFYLILASIFGFLMAWGVGANDVANAMGTSVGSKALTIKQAIIIATFFEFIGAFFAGGQVTDTIRKGLIDVDHIDIEANILILGMLASLLAAATWLIVASRFGWPVSTSHTIVGAIVGFAAFTLGTEAVEWERMSHIALSWVLSPLLGGILAYILYSSVQKLILNQPAPFLAAKKVVPYYMFLVGLVVASLTFVNGIDHLGLDLPNYIAWVIAILFGLGLVLIGKFFIRRIKDSPNDNQHFHYANVEKVFAILMLFTACAMAFAHGSNDVANAIGPLAAIEQLVTSGKITEAQEIPVWILLLGSLGIVLGLIMYGHKVIATVGSGITELTPTRGFAATFAAAITVVMASGTGLPISTTHTLVGAVLGVGLAKGINALNLNVIRTILMSWIVTLPAGALLSISFFHLFKYTLHI
ncbi:inorganic phosphate transporter [Candidatus Berkiella cookevillensis]|uniref:Phosphate transporter n=1 Tax=Candidatus Berkiella cookevillensis TaxID=437022 RepID=A0A0Q9YAM7_9GAMM|nr:inorganic phosphate transporter [Candidatus Berkiella cookevillensis]MCS5709517.1 inorganic phosphate transporter [Candidatus Berkiella cookevillensis]